MGNETVTRKASFKCPVPNKAASHRVARRVVLPASTVQALTFKFNELSQINQEQKGKNVLGGNGKQGTIKIVIRRKPSISKHKKTDEVLRKRFNMKKVQFNENEVLMENNYIQKNVLQKISKYEEMKNKELNLTQTKTRTVKMNVPKILVDIDLDAENCTVNHKVSVSGSLEKTNSTPAISEKNLSVKTAINIFETNNNRNSVDSKDLKTEMESANEDETKQDTLSSFIDKENIQEAKTKPIAAVKPILKKPEDKTLRKTKLSPKDSLNRKKYVVLKKEFLKKENTSDDGTGNQNGLNYEVEAKNVGVTEKRFENYSSLHKRILQPSLSVINNEISLKENDPVKVESEGTTDVSQTLKPNTSFLWSKKDSAITDSRPLVRSELSLPVPPDNFFPYIVDEIIYDDVRKLSSESEGEESDKLSDSDDKTYDDIGIYWKDNFCETEDPGKTGLEIEKCRVRAKNIRNKISEYTGVKEKPFNFYDDGEGEKYQYISDNTESIQSIEKSNEFEAYQYIQNGKDDSNIYEDIQSVKSHVNTNDKTKDIYEDINCMENCMTDNGLINNCYESVYNGIYSSNNGVQPYLKSDRSDTSNTSGKSAYERSNSLYGMSAGNVEDSDRRLNTRNGNNLSSFNFYEISTDPPCSESESSQSNSDEWVEVSESESEETIYLVHERPKKVRNGGGTWTQKERRRWKRLQKKSKFLEEETKFQNSDDHVYESVGHYENAEIISENNSETVQTDQPHHLKKEDIIPDEQLIDDFDSQSSEDESCVNTKLPDVPNHGYNLTKSLKAAGQKLRKNLSLRKSDLSKSLKRFKKSSRPKVNEVVFSDNKEIKVYSLSSPENLPSNTTSKSAIYSNTSDLSSIPPNFVKSKSSNDLKNQKQRKSWTFKNKFKSSSSLDTSDTSQMDANRNSTFYLSLNEIQSRRNERNDDLLNEIQTILSNKSSDSSESFSEKADRDLSLRLSDSGSVVQKPRPNVPPPPPPPQQIKGETYSEKTKYMDILWGEKATNNSLYVESGLFDKQKKHSKCSDMDTSLYAEIGLYAANSNIVSNKKNQIFIDEPLYQFYTECVNQRARDDILNNYDSEGYEEINDFYSVINEKRRTIDIKNVRPNFEDFRDDPRPDITPFRSFLDKRTLWCQIPAVIDSCILETLSEQGRKLQEAKFEILTSEGSYMNSLNVLETHFMKKVGDLNMISKRDFRILFSNIVAVKKCSENFLEDLENCWQNNVMLNGICDIVYKHATTSFQVYTKYCKNQVCIYRTLRELVDKNQNFESALKEIESDPICQNLNIHSFLMLPMQRITRLPLLMGAVLARLDKTDDEYEVCKAAFDVLNKIVQDCDDEARRMEKCEEMLILSQQIEFPKDIRRIPIITGSRFLVKSGQVTQLVNRDENKLTFGKKFSKVTLTLFLFTDLLIVAKKKNPRNYVVIDHCPRNLVQMQTTDGLSQLPVKLNTGADSGGKLLMLLTMLENHEKKTVEMILSFEMESDRQRWLEAVTPKLSENPDECIYEEWDCPQVISLYEFTPSQPDELNLCIGDIVNVLKKMNDGWYQGERLRDGARGWFPQNHTQEISSSHVRAKNKKLRYKLLALSGNFIDSQKANGK